MAKRINIEGVVGFISSRGGQCLSTEYVNSRTHLIIECENKHIWSINWDNIKSGYWCPHCYGKLLKSISDAQSLAKKFNGECLSEE